MSDENALTTSELLSQIQHGWDGLHTYLKTLSEAQLTLPTDAAGWTVKDHLNHISAWEDSIYAMLTHQPRAEYLGVDADTWKNGGFDAINEVLRKRYMTTTPAAMYDQLEMIHNRVLKQIETLTDNDLQKPISFFQADSTKNDPIIGWIVGNTFDHYAEHMPWIAAIVAQK